MIEPIYRCTQAALYAVARTGWGSYSAQLAAFTAYRGYYLAPYGTAALAEITAAEALPEAQARYANIEVLRTELVTLAATCRSNWQTLKRYITTSFPQPAVKPRLEEAGANKYEKAINENWEEIRMMNVMSDTFLTTHAAALSAGMNMPPTFPTASTAANTAFATKYQAFLDSEEQAIVDTDVKINANNTLYTKLINMFKDGQEIYKTNEVIKRQFTFDTVLSLIDAPSTPATPDLVLTITADPSGIGGPTSTNIIYAPLLLTGAAEIKATWISGGEASIAFGVDADSIEPGGELNVGGGSAPRRGTVASMGYDVGTTIFLNAINGTPSATVVKLEFFLED